MISECTIIRLHQRIQTGYDVQQRHQSLWLSLFWVSLKVVTDSNKSKVLLDGHMYTRTRKKMRTWNFVLRALVFGTNFSVRRVEVEALTMSFCCRDCAGLVPC